MGSRPQHPHNVETIRGWFMRRSPDLEDASSAQVMRAGCARDVMLAAWTYHHTR